MAANITSLLIPLWLILVLVSDDIRMPRYDFSGVAAAFVLATAFGAYQAQTPVEASAHVAKVIQLMIIAYFSAIKPKAALSLLIVAAILDWVMSVLTNGYSKLTQFPFELFALVFLFGKGDKNARRLMIVAALVAQIIQANAIHSRTNGTSAAFILLAMTLSIKWQERIVAKTWLFPIIYGGIMAILGGQFAEDEGVFDPTSSNVERTMMVYALLMNLPNIIFHGYPRADFADAVNTLMSVFGLKAYSEDFLDPHSEYLFLLMYSGLISMCLGIYLIRRALMSAVSNGHERLMELGYPVLISGLLWTRIATNTFATDSRLVVGVLIGLLLGLITGKSAIDVSDEQDGKEVACD